MPGFGGQSCVNRKVVGDVHQASSQADSAEARLLTRLRTLVPGLPEGASTETSLVPGGPLSTVQRVLVRRVVASVRPDLDPVPLDLCRTIGDLATFLGSDDPVIPVADLPDVARSYIRPLAPGDYEAVYHGMFSSSGRPSLLQGRTPPPEQFGATLWSNTSHQFAVCSRVSGRVLGLISVYDSHLDAGTCRMRTHRLVAPADSELGSIVDGFVQVIDHLLAHLPIRKIYLDVPGWTIDSLGGVAGDLLDVEGHLRNHEWFGGRTWDRTLLAVWRSRWVEWRTQWPDTRVMEARIQ